MAPALNIREGQCVVGRGEREKHRKSPAFFVRTAGRPVLSHARRKQACKEIWVKPKPNVLPGRGLRGSTNKK